MNNIIECFDSMSKLIHTLGKRNNNEIMSGRYDSEKENNDGWYGTNSYREATDYALNGYEKPLNDIKRGVIKVETNYTTPHKCRVVNDVIGHAPCVPAAILGLPQSMIRQESEAKKSKVIEILYAPTMNSFTTSETINKAGVSVLSIINNLEKNGYRVALTVLFKFSKECADRVFAMLKVKDWKQPLDLKKIAFPLCCSAMQRRFGFKWLETCKGLQASSWRSGYGRSLQSYSEAKDALKEAGLLSDRQFFINVELCQNNNFDINKIVEQCGLSKLK